MEGWEVIRMSIRVLSVTAGSPADRAGIHPGDAVEEINGEPVLDEIDYQALTAHRRLAIRVLNPEGELRTVQILKGEWDPLGLCLDETVIMKPRHCRNHCIFCFIDQMPQGMRESLYVKDDDWRLSLMMGNYVTLTNVNDAEFDRILRRRASPLYISVQATDPEVRCRMLRNPSAGNLMDRLRRLHAAGLSFHSQVVLCPGVNDGDVLHRTIADLVSLAPSAQSLAIVPIGLTGHREGLEPMKGFDADSARKLIRSLEPVQAWCLKNLGTRFVFPSDEFYCLSGEALPPDEAYEDYGQIENGVGLLRQLQRECEEAAEEFTPPDPLPAPRHLLIATGVSARPYIEKLACRYAPEGTRVEVLAVPNRFFGETITVTGLIVGSDLIHTLRGRPCDVVLICASMLREQTDRFLDDLTLTEVQEAIGKPIQVVENNGEAFLRALWGLEISK